MITRKLRNKFLLTEHAEEKEQKTLSSSFKYDIGWKKSSE